MSPKTSNQMDPPMQVSAWVTYPVGVVGLLVSAAVAIRENEHHEEARLRRHHTTDKASIPPVDGGWHP
jgi:hypothetical protein